MAAFKLKSQLPKATQDEMDRILAIATAQRTSTEAAFLTALGSDYIYNTIISYDSSGYILQASGRTVPTGDSGFAHGATFIDSDSADKAIYENIGTTSVSSWNLMGQESAGDITLATNKILVGGAGGTAAAVDLSGDATIVAAGQLTLTKYVTHDLYLDGSRADTYTVDGSYEHPYKTLSALVTGIKALYTAAADKQTTNYVVHVAAGTYADNVEINTVKYLRFEGRGVTFSGTILLNQSPIGGTAPESYTRVEFVGMDGWRSEKGYAFTISGAMTLERDNDSLTYLTFKGVYVTGAILGDTKGTWVVQNDGSYINGSITMTPTDATSCMLLEARGFARFNGTINGTVTLSKVDLAEFSKAITITPIATGGDFRITNSSFAVSASIIGTRTLYMDAMSWKSLNALTPTLTGMTLSRLDGAMAYQESNAISVTGGTITGVSITPTTLISPTATPVNAVAAVGTITLTGVVTEGETFTVGTDVFEFDSDGSVTSPNFAVDISGVSTPAQGTLTATAGGNQIAAGYTVTLGSGGAAKTYTFASPLTPTEGEVLVGANDTASLLNLLNAINHTGTPGTDYSCAAAHTTIHAVSSNATTLVAEANIHGVVGNAYAATSTGAEISWDGAGTLGTTQAGVDCTAADADGIMIAEHLAHKTQPVTAAQGVGTTVTFTADTKGVGGNAVVFLESITNATIDGAGVLGGTVLGVAGTAGDQWQTVVDGSYVYVCIAANTATDANWRRISLGSAY